jgi:Zn finger protein HypA/HybF involved in hydrogenase expression
MAKELCQDCECVFYPKSHKAMICPKCHRKRLSQYAKERKLNKLGNEAYSKQQANRMAEE